MDPNRIPDGIEPLVGYRMWSPDLAHHHATLHSLGCSRVQPCPWEWGLTWVTACCSLDRGHAAPSEDCSCGIYALKNLSDLMELVAAISSDIPSVLGCVQLAGKIIEHDTGYRAERARIVELIPIEGQTREVMLIANWLGLRMSRAVSGRSVVSHADEQILPPGPDEAGALVRLLMERARNEPLLSRRLIAWPLSRLGRALLNLN